jgi:hypothetical protein
MAEPNNIQVFQMSSGTLVISEVVKSEGDEVTLRYPLEMNFTFDDEGATRLYLNRWMPYSSDDIVTVNTRTIESKTVCSEKYRDMYGIRTTHFKQLVQKALEYIEPDVEEDESQEESNEGVPDHSYTKADTIH